MSKSAADRWSPMRSSALGDGRLTALADQREQALRALEAAYVREAEEQQKIIAEADRIDWSLLVAYPALA
jgi:hypothetical protein